MFFRGKKRKENMIHCELEEPCKSIQMQTNAQRQGSVPVSVLQ